MPDIRTLSTSLAEKAAKELNEAPERIDAALTAIREWLLKTPHIKSRTDDQFLVAFLRGCKYSVETVKDKLDVYYTVRFAIPELMKFRDPLDPKMASMLKLGLAVPMPKTYAPDAPVVVLIQSGAHNPSIISIGDFLALALINTDIYLMEDDSFTIAGQILIFDLKNVSMAHIVGATPQEMKRLVYLNQEAVPVRQKALHFINAPPSCLAAYNMVKSLVCDKVKKRMIMHETIDDLHKYIPKSILPTEYGGESGPFSDMIIDWNKRVLSKREFLLDDLNYGIDVTKIQGRSTLCDWISTGVEGTFRKLDMD